MLKLLVKWRWYMVLALAQAVLLALGLLLDWRFLGAFATLLVAWLVALPRSPRWLGVVGGAVVLRHELGWESGSVGVVEFDKAVLYRRPIPPGQMRMHVRNRVLHIDSSRVHPACISRFCEQLQALGKEVDSQRLRESAFTRKPAPRPRFRMPGSR